MPPSQDLALVNAITQRFQRPLTSQRVKFCLSTGGPGEHLPRPCTTSTARLPAAIACSRKRSKCVFAAERFNP